MTDKCEGDTGCTEGKKCYYDPTTNKTICADPTFVNSWQSGYKSYNKATFCKNKQHTTLPICKSCTEMKLLYCDEDYMKNDSKFISDECLNELKTQSGVKENDRTKQCEEYAKKIESMGIQSNQCIIS